MGGISYNKINSINVSINRSLRSILNVKFTNYTPNISTNEMYVRLNLLKFKDLYNFFILKFIHSFLYGNQDTIFQNHFIQLMPTHSYNTRENKINYPNIRLEVEKCLPVYNSVRVINEFPDFLLLPQSACTLKNKYKTWIIEKYKT